MSDRYDWRHWFGVPLDSTSTRERWISVVGGATAILAVILVSNRLVGLEGAGVLVGSMGASAVLLFAVPHGQLAQPWAVLGGQLLSALVGVTCARWIDPFELAAALAVGLAIGVMQVARCIHPPGGATALAAVVGGEAVLDLGYSFVWRPVLLNTVTILAVAVAFNAVFPWRRYPIALVSRPALAPLPVPPGGGPVHPALTHDDVRTALRSIESFIDVTEDDLIRLHELLSRPPS